MNRNIIKIFGLDAEIFLQNLTTNDLTLCTTSNPIYSCLLSPKGRYQFDFFIIRIDDYFLIDISSNLVEIFLSALKYRKLISKVNFEILPDYKVYNTKIKIIDAIISFKDPRLDSLGFRTISTKYIEEANLLTNYHEIRYINTIPESEDFTFDKSIPIEFGMDELNAISYSKGCYLGQEFTNSAKNRMAIRQRLISISSNFVLNENDIITTIDNTEVGKIVSILNLDNTTNYLAMSLFKMKYKNENVFINNKKIIKNIPSWMKIYTEE